MSDQAELQVVDVDELARGKVQEIENLLSKDDKISCHQATFNSWFSVLKQIITAADLHRTNDKTDKEQNSTDHQNEVGESIYADYADDNEQFNAVNLTEQFATNSVKWTIRVQAFKIVHRLVRMFTDPATTIRSSGKSSQSRKTVTPLSRHLSDLVRLAFVAATSPYDELKMQGFEMFQFLIDNFAQVEEKEFPGHSILEQYRTQFFSAVKPAFNLDAPPYITAIACRVCSLWICQGLERSTNDLVRACQLMSLSIDKLHKQSINHNSKLYTESELEQERVEILGAWAQLFVASIEYKLNESQRLFNCLSKSDSMILQELVVPQLSWLTNKWWEALKDYALLIMPAPRLIGVSHDNENVYTREVALDLFAPIWPKIVYALSIRLCSKKYPIEFSNSNNNSSRFSTSTSSKSLSCDNGLSAEEEEKVDDSKAQSNQTMNDDIPKYVNFLCGILMRDFYRCQVVERKSTKEQQSICDSTIIAIKSTHLLLSESDYIAPVILSDVAVVQEFYCSIYALSVKNTRDPSLRQLIKDTLDILFKSALQRVVERRQYIDHGLARSIGLLMKSMKDIELAIKEKSAKQLEANKGHLFTRLNHLIAMVTGAPETMDEVQLREGLIVVFQEMLQFVAEPSVGCTLLEYLWFLYDSLSEKHVSYFVDQLLPIQLTRISDLIGPGGVDGRVNLRHIKVYLRGTRSSINVIVEESQKRKMVNLFVEKYLDMIAQVDGGEKQQAQQDQLDELLVSELIQLSKSLADFETLVSADVKVRLNSLLKARQDAKERTSARPATTIKKLNQVSVKTKAAPNKITLRADFSNFYTK